MAASGASGASTKSTTTPREVQVIQAILKDMGVIEYEPAVINQLLDFTYRYTTDILEDARAFSTHAGKKSIDVDDTKLAVQLKLDKNYTNPPPRELLLDVAAHRNSQSLPLIKPYTGPKVPSDRNCLTAMNYQLRTSKKPALSYSLHSLSGVRQGSKASLLSPGVSLVNRAATQAAGARPVKSQPTSFRQSTVINTGAATQQPSQAMISALSSNSAPRVKRKLEPEDDYDA